MHTVTGQKFSRKVEKRERKTSKREPALNALHKRSLWNIKEALDMGNQLQTCTHTRAHTEPHKRMFTIGLKNNFNPGESIKQQFNSHVDDKLPQNGLCSFRLYWWNYAS